MPKVFKSKCTTTKFGSFFEHVETGKKKKQNVISSSTHNLISLIFAIHIFFYQTLTDGVGLVDRAFADIFDHSFYMSVQLHWKITI